MRPTLGQDAAVDALEKVGQPVVRIALGEPHDLGQEFFRWEIAVAIGGRDPRHQTLSISPTWRRARSRHAS